MERVLSGPKRRARLVRQLPGTEADARFYWIQAGGRLPEWVVISTTKVFGSETTLVFEADSEGTVLSWERLAGSFEGGLDHAHALWLAGYVIVTELPR